MVLDQEFVFALNDQEMMVTDMGHSVVLASKVKESEWA